MYVHIWKMKEKTTNDLLFYAACLYNCVLREQNIISCTTYRAITQFVHVRSKNNNNIQIYTHKRSVNH